MKRRSFLKAITVAAPAAGLQDFPRQSSPRPSPGKRTAVVGAGEDRSAHLDAMFPDNGKYRYQVSCPQKLSNLFPKVDQFQTAAC